MKVGVLSLKKRVLYILAVILLCVCSPSFAIDGNFSSDSPIPHYVTESQYNLLLQRLWKQEAEIKDLHRKVNHLYEIILSNDDSGRVAKITDDDVVVMIDSNRQQEF